MHLGRQQKPTGSGGLDRNTRPAGRRLITLYVSYSLVELGFEVSAIVFAVDNLVGDQTEKIVFLDSRRREKSTKQLQVTGHQLPMIHHHYFPCRTVADLDEVDAVAEAAVADLAADYVEDMHLVGCTINHDAAVHNP